MDTQKLQDPAKVSTIWVKNVNSIVNKMNNTKSSMIGMKPKEAIKRDTVKLDKSETHPEKDVLPEDGLYRHLYQAGQQHGDQKSRATDFIRSKNTYRLDRVIEEPGNRFCTIYKMDQIELLYVKNLSLFQSILKYPLTG